MVQTPSTTVSPVSIILSLSFQRFSPTDVSFIPVTWGSYLSPRSVFMFSILNPVFLSVSLRRAPIPIFVLVTRIVAFILHDCTIVVLCFFFVLIILFLLYSIFPEFLLCPFCRFVDIIVSPVLILRCIVVVSGCTFALFFGKSVVFYHSISGFVTCLSSVVFNSILNT